MKLKKNTAPSGFLKRLPYAVVKKLQGKGVLVNFRKIFSSIMLFLATSFYSVVNAAEKVTQNIIFIAKDVSSYERLLAQIKNAFSPKDLSDFAVNRLPGTEQTMVTLAVGSDSTLEKKKIIEIKRSLGDGVEVKIVTIEYITSGTQDDQIH